MAGQRNLVVQLRRGLRRVERDLEFRTLVFFDVDIRLTSGALRHVNPHRAHQSVARRGETAAERTVVVATMLLPRDFLVVRIGENDGQFAAGEHFVVVLLVVHAETDAFVLNRLTRTINCAVGEKNGLVISALTLVVVGRVFLLRTQLAPVVTRAKEVAPLVTLEREETILVRGQRRLRNAIALIVQTPRHDLRAGDRLAGIRFEHETLDLTVAPTQHEREVAHPDVRECDLVVRLAEIGFVARNEEIKAGLELVRLGQCFSAFLVVRRRWQIR